MRYPKNAPVYYIPCARFKHSHTYFGVTVPKGSELPLYQEELFLNYNNFEVKAMFSDDYACNIVPVPLAEVELFVKIVQPKFKVGDIVVNKDSRDETGIYRVWEYTIIQGTVWYRNGWSVATGCESGVYEEKLRLAEGDELKSWTIEYLDSLVREKELQRYAAIMHI